MLPVIVLLQQHDRHIAALNVIPLYLYKNSQGYDKLRDRDQPIGSSARVVSKSLILQSPSHALPTSVH